LGGRPWILYFTLARIPGERAHSIQIARMCAAFQAEGADVFLFSARRGSELSRSADIKEVMKYYGLSHGFKLARLLVPDILIGSKSSMSRKWKLMTLIYALQAALLANMFMLTMLGRRVFAFVREPILLLTLAICAQGLVYEVHDIPRLHSTAGRVLAWALRRCKLIVTISSFQASYLRLCLRAPPPVLVAHDAVDERLFMRDLAVDLGCMRNRLDIPPSHKIILYVGQLSSWKKPEFIVDAFAELGRSDATLLFIGGGEDDIARVKRYAEQRGLRSVRFVGWVRPSAVPRFLKLADVLVHYTPHNRMTLASGALRSLSPLKIFEYMLAGRPIVAPRTPGVVEVLKDGVNALLFDPDDPKDMAAKITTLLDNQELGRRLAEQARQQALQEHTYQYRARRILEALKRVN